MIRSLEPEIYEMIYIDEDSEWESDSNPRFNLFIYLPISFIEDLNSISGPIECGDLINSEIDQFIYINIRAMSNNRSDINLEALSGEEIRLERE